MHEWKTARDVAARVLEFGRDARSVTHVRIRLGATSHLTEETFRERLDMLFAGTNVEGATIAVSRSVGDGADVRLESIDVEA